MSNFIILLFLQFSDTSVSSVSMEPVQSYTIGDVVIIQCNITLSNKIGPNISSLQIKWFHNNISTTDKHISISPTSTVSSLFITTLTISQVQTSDAGIYTCSANIIGHSATTNITDLCLKGITNLIYIYYNNHTVLVKGVYFCPFMHLSFF